MRDLTKSMTSFSWALSLFGLRQMTSMLTPQGWKGANSSFDHVTRSTEDQLGAVTRSIFRAGDGLQRGMVDLMFNMLSLGGTTNGDQGGDAFRRSAQWSADVINRSADAIRQAASDPRGPGAPAASGPSSRPSPGPSPAPSGETGWGPMPGTR
jgi:hypothetical protein